MTLEDDQEMKRLIIDAIRRVPQVNFSDSMFSMDQLLALESSVSALYAYVQLALAIETKHRVDGKKR